jgi:thiamine kinase-like enzyme
MRFAGDVPERDRPLIERLLASWDIPGPAAVEVLAGGANNRNYVVDAGRGRYAMRIANTLSERLSVDRSRAIQAQRDAAAAGLAPDVVGCTLPEGHLLSVFVDGETLDPQTVREPETLAIVATALRTLHGTPTSCGRVSPFADVRQWMALARADGSEMPDDADRLLDAVDRVEAAVESAALPWAFCHNDIVPMNIIVRGGRAQLVDWDYGGQGHAAFELASFANTATLDDALLDVLLEAYDGDASEEQRAMISLLRFVAALREAAWALMATPLLAGETEPGAFSYRHWYEENLDAARENLDAPDLGRRLEAAARTNGSRRW